MFTNFCVNNQQCWFYKSVKIKFKCRSPPALETETYDRTKIIVCIYLFSFHTTLKERNFRVDLFSRIGSLRIFREDLFSRVLRFSKAV